MSFTPSSAPSDPSLPANPTSSGARSTRATSGVRNSSVEQFPARRGLTPISTGHVRPPSASDSPSRAALSPTSSGYNLGSVTASRQVTSRQSSTSSSNSFVTPSVPAHAIGSFHSGNRSRAVTASGSPRLTPTLTNLAAAQQGGGGAASAVSRFARHSPSLSLSTAGSPTTSLALHSAGPSSGQLTSLVITQLNILLSTIKEDKDRVKWEAQAEKIRRLVHDSGMDLFIPYFRRLLQSNASTIFPGSARPPAGAENAGTYQLLIEEMQKMTKDPQQADNIATSLDTSDGELFRDFDLSTFIEHFRLDPVTKVALLLSCRAVSKSELRTKADSILPTSFPTFYATVASPNPESELECTSTILATIIERLVQDPPRNWIEEQRENLLYAIRVRYNRFNMRTPAPIELAIFLAELFDSRDASLAKLVQRTGPRGTSSIDACREMLVGVATPDFSYSQIANALLFMVITQNGDAYDPSVFVEAVRQHRAGTKIDWTDVVQGFDRDHLRVTKKHFLALYRALFPLAQEYANFDIQSLWGGKWQCPETQLSFVVAFLSTTAEELDVMQIPNLRQAFDLTDFATASDNVRAFAEQAIKHPLVSKDATQALFTMIFRTQETYNLAQVLGIPDTVINQNMTIFVCAASAVDGPWAPLQDQALKQLFYPFLLKQHDNYDFVMHSLWQHARNWVAQRMVEFYQQDQMLLVLIFEHALEHNWLEPLCSIQNTFAIDLAAYAHGRDHFNLEEWAQLHISTLGSAYFARAIMEFLRAKMEDETLVQRQGSPPTSAPLQIKTIHTLLLLIADGIPDETVGVIYRQCLQLYPRLFNYGEDDARDGIIRANGDHGNALPEAATREMEERYKDMYGGNTNPDNLVSELNRLKVSDDPAEQDLFAAMLLGLFDEYSCFGEYPNEALATTAVLFGGLVSYHVLSGVSEQAAIFMIFEAVSEFGPEDPMYRFGLQALIHLLSRLKEWPHLAERILHIPGLRGTQAFQAAENALKELQQKDATLNGDGTNGITNGVLDDELPTDAQPPPFTAVRADSPVRDGHYEDPNEEVSDRVMFVLNNVSKRNFAEKFKEIEGALDDKYHQWFAHYLVEELAKNQPNFQTLYLQILETFGRKSLWKEVLRETYASCQRILNAPLTMELPHERATMKNLAGWLGSITLARNQPILHRNISFKDLLIEGHDTQRLIVAIPFTCKALIQAQYSKIFKPPNPWMMDLIGVLSELYHCMEMRINLKFEIEMLCRELDIDIKSVEPLNAIRGRQLVDNSMLQQYVPESGPDAFGDMALMGLSKRGPNDRFSPDAVIRAVPDLGSMLQIPQAVGNITQQDLRNIFVNAAQQAIYEIIAPVVERSVTIASISTSELIQKDFSTEGDEAKVRNSAHTVVKALSGSLALVTCKEPLRMSITNNIRILASRNLPEQLPEGQILMFVNDNIDTVCSLVERAAEEHSLAEIDLQLQAAIDDRRQHNEQRPNEPFAHTPVNRWATMIPEPYRQDQNGLNRQQLALYDDFGRQARMPPASHVNNPSQDSSRQLPDILNENYLPNMPTPAEAPAIPRQAQSQRMQAMQPGQSHQMNGYADSPNIGQRILELLQELQQSSREADEEHISEIGEGAPIRRIYEQLVTVIEASHQRDSLATLCGQHCLGAIYSDAQKRLEVEVFVRLLMQLCRMSVQAGRHLTVQLATSDDDRIFNAAATVALHNEGLIDLSHIDGLAAKALHARRPIVLGFLKDVLNELLLGENDVALRADFVLSFDALTQWLGEDPSLQAGQEIASMLQIRPSQQNGMSSPVSDKHDQLEYIFEEWIRLQGSNTPERAYTTFVKQLHSRRIIGEPEETIAFVRTCMEMSTNAFDRISSLPFPSQDQAYLAVDAFAKLIVLVVHYQGPTPDQRDKAKLLDSLLRLVILIMGKHHNDQRERWNGRVYYRLFSTVLCEFDAIREQLSAELEHDLYSVFASALTILQPRHFPGFSHCWLALLAHRLFVPALLKPTSHNNDGWRLYLKVLAVLFRNLGEMLAVPEISLSVQDLYRGVLRLFTMLHHDFPDFLVENHLELDSVIPVQCPQLLNIVNCAATRTAYSDQPDPFTPGLKINRLEQVRQAPVIFTDMDKTLEDAGLKISIDRVCHGDVTDEEFGLISSAVNGPEVTPLLINTLVLYTGAQATSASSVFSAGAAPARLLERLLRESSFPVRHLLISAMANQIRYVNSHTHYFTTALLHLFSVFSPSSSPPSGSEIQEQILRVICGRLIVPRPHPWGLIVLILELVKNPSYDLWNLGWMKTSPQIESLLVGLAHSATQDQRGGGPGAGGGSSRSPLLAGNIR